MTRRKKKGERGKNRHQKGTQGEKAPEKAGTRAKTGKKLGDDLYGGCFEEAEGAGEVIFYCVRNVSVNIRQSM